MSEANKPHEKAAELVAEASRRHAAGAAQAALDALRQAVLLYASEGEEADTTLLRQRADACALYGDYLTEAEEYANAANVYQEATDLYSRLEEAEEEAQRTARKILLVIAALQARPQERLYLLIARYERMQQQLALQPGTEHEQADCVAHIGHIFQRRERYPEAVARYGEALTLYTQAPQSPESGLALAETHHRMAGLFANYLEEPNVAIRHYRKAIALYAEYEPVIYGRQAACDLCRRALAEIENWRNERN